MTRIFPTDIVGVALIAIGLLAFLFIDPEGPPVGGGCPPFEECTIEAWRQPATIQGVLVVFGMFGVGLMGWGFIRRQHDDRT